MNGMNEMNKMNDMSEMKWNEMKMKMKWNEMKPNGLKLKGHSNDTEVKLNAWKKEWNNALKWNWNEIKLKTKGNKMKWNEMKCNERMKEWQNKNTRISRRKHADAILLTADLLSDRHTELLSFK